MIYTLGNYGDLKTVSALMAGTVSKVGRRPLPDHPDYRGGIAFYTRSGAAAWRDEHQPTWSVYGLDCERDNMWWDDESNHHRIINDAAIQLLAGDEDAISGA